MEDSDGRTNEPVSSEEIAAFLDGRLGKERRDEVADRIASDDDAYAAFSEAAHYMQSDAPPRSEAEPNPTPASQWWLQAIAAVVVGGVALWIASMVGTDPTGFAGDLQASLGLPGDAVSVYLYPNDPNVFGFTGPSPAVVSFRLGIARLDLELSRLSGEARERASASLAARSATVTGAVANAVEATLEEPTDAAVRQLDSAIESELDAFHYRFGQWAEASRIAAASGNTAYFSDSRYQDFLAQAETQTLTPEASDILARIGEASSETVIAETLQGLFDDLILEF